MRENCEVRDACNAVNLLKQRVEQLESAKTDVELRLRRLERAMYLGTGMIMALQLVLKFWVKA